jgi:hypothetical protein
LGSSCASDSCSAMWRRVRIEPADGLPDFFATLAAALAAAFVGLLADAPEAPAALADTDFDAAALRAGAFLVVVLVAVFATGETLLMSCHSRHYSIGNLVADQD